MLRDRNLIDTLHSLPVNIAYSALQCSSPLWVISVYIVSEEALKLSNLLSLFFYD